jgi:acetylornithine deacetylase/succinyl-diaminopimelate desuccinylase-like protein
MTFVEACRAWKKVHGSLPCRITILFEGEEESGSPSLKPFIEANAAELKADFALVCDTSMWDEATPAISVSLRGLVGEEITVKAANRDLHSGHFGGAAANPIRILTRILADVHDETGRVTIPGFYDGVEETPTQILDSWNGLGMTAEKFLGPIGLSEPAGEKGRSVLELIWARPTAEFNGITGGYTGKGFKTVIAAEASAKVSFRLVHKQDPVKIRAAFREFVEARIPADCSVEFEPHGGSPAIQLSYDSPFLTTAQGALTDEWNKPAVMIAMGGSIPIVGDFKSMLGMESLLVGYALEDDRIHSPNEKYNLASFHKGQRSWARILDALANAGAAR